ncbi:DUF6049 family protein [Brachybacterium tyrofermentans]|uniref:DUF6049 family protein n=1 Tax=Brachybacterium tyrofermentans TaxID=47848 RepID=UPI003FD59354
MPSSPLPVRPVLAALLTALLLASSVLVGGLSSPAPAAHAAGAPAQSAAPSAPPPPAADAPVSMDLVSLTPTSLDPDGTLTAEVEVTNDSSKTLPDVALQLRTRTSRVTDRAMLAEWQADTSADTSGAALASSDDPTPLAPGESRTLTVEASAEELGYSEAPYYWGTRRISLTAVAEGDPLGAIRSFVVWRPADADAAITQSVLLPVASRDPAAAITDPEAAQQSLESGHLATTRALALRDDVDWWLDPALLDPPQLLVDPTPEADTAEEDAEHPVPTYAPDPGSTELATALVEGVGERTVLAMPYAQADLVSLGEAGATTMSSVATDRAQTTWDATGINPRARVMGLEGSEVDAASLQQLVDAGAGAAIIPSTSLQENASSTVTPSSFGVYESEDGSGSELPLLAPDPVLSDEFSLLTADSDTEQTQQRLLAETATIASEFTTAPRHLLISPNLAAELDPTAAGAALDAFAEAPWIETGSTDSLLTAASQRAWTTHAQDDSGTPFALGRVSGDDLLPSGPGTNGRWEHLEAASDPELLDAPTLTAAADTWTRLDTLASVMEDDASLAVPRLELLTSTSRLWRGSPERSEELARSAETSAEEMQGKIEVVPASGYNLISDSVGVPVTISNGLDTPITVSTRVTSDRPLVQIGDIEAVEVPARSQVDATVPVDAVANGTVTLTTVLTSEDGQVLTEPATVPLTVNPAWENWTTLVVVIAMGVLVIVGVARARHTGASTRAPAAHGPEDPVELSRSGLSTADTGTVAAIWSERAKEPPSAAGAGAPDTGSSGTGSAGGPDPAGPPDSDTTGDTDTDITPDTDIEPREEDRS